ncbi:hypothetical protein B0H21DRAFT_223424 [Amylocystis lapponica]|nr:hypothetical protein B0H21DRAFT_223424 [Amylocystis lapponica]
MSLLSPSESVAFNGFLSSVDHPNAVEWNGFTPDLADKIPHKHGKEALAKATADLMSLGSSSAPKHPSSSRRASMNTASAPPTSSTSSHWPSFSHDSHGHTAEQSGSSSHTFDRHSAYSFSSYPQSHSHLPTLQTFGASSSAFTLPPISHQDPSRPAFHSSASDPHSSAHSKRAHTSDEPSASSSKRARPSASPFPAPPHAASAPPQTQDKARRASSAKRPAAPQPSKPALLSPSQKRANHIQSEQKRRANIRRGYEALCDAVPSLREAIRLEDAAAAAAGAAQEAEKGGKRRRKPKADDEKPDGRAGPRSENVVLQKTIDYISALRGDRDSLVDRLNYARNALSPGHPALRVAPAHVDEHGVPLWEREWGGGMASADDGMEDGDGEGEGSDDEE